jgi:hypothetical protein
VDLDGIDHGGIADAGALELQPEPARLGVTTALDTIDAFDGETSLREAVAAANAGLAGVITFGPGIALGCVDKAHPAMDCGDLNEAEEACGGLVVAGGDASKLLQQAHHALDAVALGVSNPV